MQMAEMISFVKKGWAPIPGPADAYFSWVSHDDAASAVAAAIGLPAGIYNVVDDEPVTHRVFFDSLAQALNVKPPKLPPTWLTPLFGSLAGCSPDRSASPTASCDRRRRGRRRSPACAKDCLRRLEKWENRRPQVPTPSEPRNTEN